MASAGSNGLIVDATIAIPHKTHSDVDKMQRDIKSNDKEQIRTTRDLRVQLLDLGRNIMPIVDSVGQRVQTLGLTSRKVRGGSVEEARLVEGVAARGEDVKATGHGGLLTNVALGRGRDIAESVTELAGVKG